MSSNFVLIGMPACGKSTLGVVAAKMLCMDFFDVDLFLQKRLGMSLQSYIEKFGTSAFLEAEADAICALELENTIISTGGSAVLTERGAKRLSELGKMENFYLTVYFEGDQKGAPMYVQVQRFPGQVSLFAGTHHLVG